MCFFSDSTSYLQCNFTYYKAYKYAPHACKIYYNFFKTQFYMWLMNVNGWYIAINHHGEL
jgi:hypothetical protein